MKTNTGGKGKVIVMDDDDMVREILGEMIKMIGYKTELAKNGNEAIENYVNSKNTDEPVDAIIMDLSIVGGMGGEETAQKLLELDPEAKLIITSGYSNDPVIENYKDYGFKDAIIKPYNMKELKESLQRVLRS